MKITHDGRYKNFARSLSLLVAFGLVGLTTASCASGGFRMTRGFAKWINSHGVVLRVILYLFLGLGFLITILLDDIVFNTIDFWSGKVSGKNEFFEKDGVKVAVAHTRLPLRKSVFDVTAKDGRKTVLELREVADQSVEVYVDGVRRAKAANINEAMHTLTFFKADGVTAKAEKSFTDQDFANLDRLPVAEGVQQAVTRLGFGRSISSAALPQ